RGRGRHGDVVGARSPGGLCREDLEVDRTFQPAKLTDRVVHMGRLAVLHPDGHVLVHNQTEERKEDEEGHDRPDGRGNAFFVPAKVADQKTHEITGGEGAEGILSSHTGWGCYSVSSCRSGRELV